MSLVERSPSLDELQAQATTADVAYGSRDVNLAPITEDEELAAANADDEVRRTPSMTLKFLPFGRTTTTGEAIVTKKAKTTRTMAKTNRMTPYALVELVRAVEVPIEPAVVVAPTKNV